MNEFKVLYLEEQTFYNPYQILRLESLEFPNIIPIMSDSSPQNVITHADIFKRDGWLWAHVHDMTPLKLYLDAGLKFWLPPCGKIVAQHQESKQGYMFKVITGANITNLVLYMGAPWRDDFTPCISDQIIEKAIEEIVL